MKKRGLKCADVFSQVKDRSRSKPREPEAQTTARNWTTPAYAWGRTKPFDHGSMKALPITPRPVIGGAGSNASQNPFSDEQRYDLYWVPQNLHVISLQSYVSKTTTL